MSTTTSVTMPGEESHWIMKLPSEYWYWRHGVLLEQLSRVAQLHGWNLRAQLPNHQSTLHIIHVSPCTSFNPPMFSF